MKMNRNEMEALYAFGCPNLKATVERLRMVAALAPDPAAKKPIFEPIHRPLPMAYSPPALCQCLPSVL